MGWWWGRGGGVEGKLGGGKRGWGGGGAMFIFSPLSKLCGRRYNNRQAKKRL